MKKKYQIAEYLFYPAKKDLDSMNGLLFLSSFFSIKPLYLYLMIMIFDKY